MSVDSINQHLRDGYRIVATNHTEMQAKADGRALAPTRRIPSNNADPLVALKSDLRTAL